MAEIEQMAEAGVFRDDDRFELIGGEIVPMSPKGRRHEIVRGALSFHLTRLCPADTFVVAEAQFNLADDAYVLPDILVHSASIKTPDLRGAAALIVIEVADSSTKFDLVTKAMLYASHGVRDYWVVDARTLVTTIHREPGAKAFGQIVDIARGSILVPLLVPTLCVDLATLDLD